MSAEDFIEMDKNMKHSKIAIIGAGTVCSTTAYTLLLRNIAAQIILVDPE
jgi:glycine/D-amino acid oxidase-like deaminating enzyme